MPISLYQSLVSPHIKMTDPKPLQAGQIIGGTVAKIYPNDQVLLKLGDRSLVARLNTALSIGGSYFFQVQSTKGLLHLRVLKETSSSRQRAQADSLLSSLQLKNNRMLQSLTQSLLDDNVAFSREQLERAIDLLDLGKNRQVTLNILKMMIQRDLPMTRSTFLALYTYEQHDFHTMLQSLMRLLRDDESPLHGRLLNQLNIFKGQDQSSTQSSSNTHQLGMKANTPETIATALPNANHVSLTLSETIEQFQGEMSRLLQSSEISPSQQEGFRQNMRRQIFPLLNYDQQQAIEELLGKEPLPLRQLLSFIQNIQVDERSPKIISNHFKQLIQHFIDQFGISQEQLLATRGSSNESIVSQLLRLMLNSPNAHRYEPFVHFITGLQLQMVQETEHFIHVQLHLPGEPLYLPKDLKISFEGKKTADGNIHPDHCRILFILTLPHLEDLIIDMHVHDRRVSLSIFNDFIDPKLLKGKKDMQQKLEKGLSILNYELQSIQFKRLEQHEASNVPQQQRNPLSSYEGIDYRI